MNRILEHKDVPEIKVCEAQSSIGTEEARFARLFRAKTGKGTIFCIRRNVLRVDHSTGMLRLGQDMPGHHGILVLCFSVETPGYRSHE